MLPVPLELVALCDAPSRAGVDDAPECSAVKQRAAPKSRAIALVLQHPHDKGAIRPGCRRKGQCRGLRQAYLHRVVLDAAVQRCNLCPREDGAARKTYFDPPNRQEDGAGGVEFPDATF